MSKEESLDNKTVETLCQVFNGRLQNLYSGCCDGEESKTMKGIDRKIIHATYADDDNVETMLENEEQAFSKAVAMLEASKRSRDNPYKREDVKLSNVAWDRPTVEQLECIYHEGVSMSLASPPEFTLRRYNGNAIGIPDMVLTIRFHIRQLQCLGLNVFWFYNRLFKDMVGIGIQTTAWNNRFHWPSLVADNSARLVPWVDLSVRHFVPPESIPDAIDYLRNNRPNLLKKMNGIPSLLAVEFQVDDNLVGIIKDEKDYLGSASIFRYGSGTTKDFKTMETTTDDAKGIHSFHVPAADVNEPMVDVPENSSWVSTLLKKNNITTDARDSTNEEGKRWLLSNLLNGQGSSEETSDCETGGGGKVSSHSWSDVIEFHTTCKGTDANELMSKLIVAVGNICQNVESSDGKLYDGPLFVKENYLELMERLRELKSMIIMVNPATTYRLAVHVFCLVLLLQLRCPNEKSIITYAEATKKRCQQQMRSQQHHHYLGEKAQNDNVFYKLQCGRMTVMNPTDTIKAKFRLTKDDCMCGIMCCRHNWIDSLRDKAQLERWRLAGKQLRNRFGQALVTVASDGYRRHSVHRYMPMDMRWLDTLQQQDKGNFSNIEDELAKDTMACDLRTECYQASQGHYIYCPNKMVCSRGPLFTSSTDRSTLSICNDDNGEVGTQSCNVKTAVDMLEKSMPYSASDHLQNANASGLSLREFASELTTMVSTMSSIDALISKNTEDEALSKMIQTKNILSNMIDTVCRYFPPIVFDETEEIANARHKFMEWSTTIHKEDMKNKKVVNRLLANYMKIVGQVARYRMKTANAAFCTAINFRQGVYAVRYSIMGSRIKLVNANRERMSVGGKVEFHQALATIDSSVVFGDYYRGKVIDEDEMMMKNLEFFTSGGDSTNRSCNNSIDELQGAILLHLANTTRAADTDVDDEGEEDEDQEEEEEEEKEEEDNDDNDGAIESKSVILPPQPPLI